MMLERTIRLEGAGGEQVDLRRTLASHGVAELPPMSIDHANASFTVTLPLGAAARTVTVRRAGIRAVTMSVPGRVPSAVHADELEATVRRILGLDDDLSAFYSKAADDPKLAWATTGAGRMVRSATVFEEVVKTICTTNCAWSSTERMDAAIVEHLGARAPGAPPDGPYGRAFPTAAAMADAGEAFYRDVARAGYRARSFVALARLVADDKVNLEVLAGDEGGDDEEVRSKLLTLPGVGPYAAAHVMMMLGRSSELILDSWTRPTYAKVIGARTVPADATIRRRFRRYGRFAGLAFWLVCTKDWIDAPTDRA